MTRKHYELIAAAVQAVMDETSNPLLIAQTRLIAGAIADACKSDNPRFDSERFLAACGFPVAR